MLIAPGHQEDQRYANADGAVRYVERRKSGFFPAALLQIEPQKIHDMLADNPVHEISHDAADDQSKGELTQHRMRVEMVPAEKQDDQRGDGDKREQSILAGKRAPGGAGILPVNDFEKTRQHSPFIPDVREKMQHDGLGELVQGKHNKRNRRDAAVGRAQ